MELLELIPVLAFLFLGPFTAKIEDKVVLAGVASAANKLLLTTKLPSVFARVSSVVNWIQQNSDAKKFDCWAK